MGFSCVRCGNKDERYVGYYKDGTPYCRACIGFQGANVEPPKERNKKKVHFYLPFSLSKEQSKISHKIVSNYQNGIDTLVYAVCGSGKTEISYGVIAYALGRGDRVAFALPRRDVVVELYRRLKEAFKDNIVVAVYGGHHDCLEGDIVVLTTHQLYRYPQYFDLIVMDEIDAFPYKGDDVLQGFFKNSLIGNSLLMSATPSDEILKEYQKKGHDILELTTRFHKQPIPVPTFRLLPRIGQIVFILKLLRGYKKERKPAFIFAPTIGEAESLYATLKLFSKGGALLHSQTDRREEKIKDLKDGRLSYLVATSVLERGVTVANLQVIVTHADHEEIYDKATLIQIAGRAGRKKEAPTGDVYFLAAYQSKAMEEAVDEIKRCNAFL